MMHPLRQRLGILRSQLIYYGKPFNRRRLRKFYSQFVRAGDLCFDVGAHLGNRSDAWLGLGARVVAIEPQPACTAYMRRRLGRRKGFTLLEQAVGAQPGTAALHVSQLTPTVSTLADSSWQQIIREKSSFEVRWDRQIDVAVVTLDQLIETYGLPAFCKIDVEDYEAEVLSGLSHAVPALSFEYFSYTPQQSLRCIELIERLGSYEYNWSHGESQVMQCRVWLDASEMVAEIRAMSPGAPSGDIYARLRH